MGRALARKDIEGEESAIKKTAQGNTMQPHFERKKN